MAVSDATLMEPATQSPPPPDERGPRSKRRRGLWLVEIAVLLACYWTYNTLRTLVEGPDHVAFANAHTIAQIEAFLGLDFEAPLQSVFLGHYGFISFWNIYYGTIHFVMPVVALVWLYRAAPARYIRWRNTLGIMLALGILAFWLYPLAPPRLMPSSYGFVDTAIGYMNFGKPATTKSEAGNFFAAMPSLHMGWSTWCTCALWGVVRPWWGKVLLVLYPACTFFAIVVTGNHWWLDAVGGWATLAIAYGITGLLAWWGSQRTARRLRPEHVSG
ncbi:MAG: phosphatase PAP2 family protein [Acidimicrobiia bacterium]